MAFNRALSEDMFKPVDKSSKAFLLTKKGENFVANFRNEDTATKNKLSAVKKTNKKALSDEDKAIIDNVKKLTSNFEQEDLTFIETLKLQKEQIYFASYMFAKKFEGVLLKPVYISSIITATGIDTISDIAAAKVFSANKKYYEIEKRGCYKFTPKGIKEMTALKNPIENIENQN
jgi:hypothetical protein